MVEHPTIAKAAVLLFILVAVATGSYCVLQYGSPNRAQPATSPNPAPSPTPTTSPKQSQTQAPVSSPTPTPGQESTQDVRVVSVSLQQPYNPAGPTINVTIQNNGSVPVVKLEATLSMSGRNYTLVFDTVSSSKPLLAGQQASETTTLLNAGFNSNQAYPLEVNGQQQDGNTFDYFTSAIITLPQPASAAIVVADGLKLTLKLDKTQYEVGEPVNVTLTLTNVSNKTIDFTHTGLDFDFRVTNDTNNLVYQWSRYKAIAQFICIMPLSPGQNLTASFLWPQTCNFSDSVKGTPVSAGAYSISGLSSRVYGLETPPVQIVVTKP